MILNHNLIRSSSSPHVCATPATSSIPSPTSSSSPRGQLHISMFFILTRLKPLRIPRITETFNITKRTMAAHATNTSLYKLNHTMCATLARP